MSPSTPQFSVIIPTRDRPERLRECLASLVEQDYPRTNFEVIVVDDGSVRPLDEVVQLFRDSVRLKLVRQPNAGPGPARNRGAAEARGEFLAFTDDDCRPDPGWLTSLAKVCVQSPEALIGGRVVNALPDNRYSVASQLLSTYLYDYFNSTPRQSRFFTSNNMAVAARTFVDVGRFSTRIPVWTGEDRELCDRWASDGRPLVYVPEALVHHAHNLTLKKFWQQHHAYGQGSYYYHRHRADRGDGRIRVEPTKFYAAMLGAPWTYAVPRRRISLMMLLAVSQVANASGFFYERFRHRNRKGNNG